MKNIFIDYRSEVIFEKINVNSDYLFFYFFFVSAYGNLGSILNAQGRGDEAENAYKMALKFRPNMADVYYNL